MTHWDEQSWIDKIRALLAKAEVTDNEHERAAYNRKAEALLAKYGVTRAMLHAAGEVDDKVVSRVMVLADPYSRQKAQLLVDIADPLRVVVILNTDLSRGIDGFQVHMFGFESDIRRVDLLLTSLLTQVTVGLASARPAFGPRPAPSALAAFRRHWLAGFGVKVRLRLIAAEQQAARRRDVAVTGQTSDAGSDGMSTDVVLANRSNLVEQAIAEAYPPQHLQSNPVRQQVNAEAFRAGVVAAVTADLGLTPHITHDSN